MNIDREWNNIKSIIKESNQKAAKELIDNNIQPGKKWFDKECEDAIKIMKKAREQWLTKKRDNETRLEYKEKRRIAHKTLRYKKKKYIEGLISSIEEDQTKKNMRGMYQTINIFKKGYQPKSNIIQDKRGRLILNPFQRTEIWKERFDELLNTEDPEVQLNINDKRVNMDEINEPTVEEVKEAIKKLKNNKAAGSDGIQSELLKYGWEDLQQEIYKIIIAIWRKETLPEEWKETILVPREIKTNVRIIEELL